MATSDSDRNNARSVVINEARIGTQLRDALTSSDVKLEPPTSLDPEHHRMLARLRYHRIKAFINGATATVEIHLQMARALAKR